MKNSVAIILLCLLIHSVLYSQVTVKLGSVENAEPGTEVHIPLIVSGLSSSGQSFIGIEIQFGFQDNIITFDTLANAHPVTPIIQWFAGSITGKVAANWLEPSLNPVNVDDNSVLVEFVFDYSGGQTDLVIDQAATLIYDANGNNLTISEFTNGSIIQAQGSESSIWNGTASWATPSNWSNGIPGDSTNAVINTGTVELTSGGVCRNLTVNGGSKIVIQPANSLSVNGNFSNDGEILIKSDSIIQGSLIVHGSISQTGSSVMEMKVYNGLSYLFSIPTETAAVNTLAGSGNVSAFDEVSNSWSAISGSEVLAPYSGYLFSASENSVVMFDGKFNSGSTTRNLQFTSQGNPSAEGWNLAGNSFTCSFDADNYLATENTDRAVYSWDGMKYRVWNGTAGSIPNGIIPPLTGFFIRANSSNAKITFSGNGRIHDFSHYESAYTAPQNVLQVDLKNFDALSINDMAFVQVEPSATFNYDGDFDAFKLNNATGYPEIYIHSQDENRLAIAAIPEATEVDAGISVPSDGTYVISAETSGFLPERPVYLIDTELEITRDLRTEDYVFIITAGDHPERFKLVFTGLGTGDLAQDNSLLVHGSHDKISINSLVQLGNSIISVYDLSGRLHSQSRANLEQGSSITVNAITGINIVSIETNNHIFHFKVFAPK